MLKSREAAALADRQEREEQYRLHKDAVKWRSIYQMHLHLATLGSTRYDPRRPLLDEPQRQHAESLARERRMRRKKLRLRRERNRRRRLRRARGEADESKVTASGVREQGSKSGGEEDSDILSSSDTDEELRRRREQKRKGRQQRQATEATRAAEKMGPLGVLQTAMGPLVSYLQPPSSDDEDQPPWSEEGHGRLKAAGVVCLPPTESDDEQGPAMLPAPHSVAAQRGSGGASGKGAGMSTEEAASQQAG